jgi:hypothetical protein
MKLPKALVQAIHIYIGLFALLTLSLITGCGGGGGSTNQTASISGSVFGSVQQGVTITLSGASSVNATTDSNGNYSISGLTNGSYTVTPSAAGYTFNPPSTGVVVSGSNIANINFVASTVAAPTYTISGTVTVSGDALGFATIHLTGATTGSTVSDGSGHYHFSGLSNGTYILTPTFAGPTLAVYEFTPQSLSATIGGANSTGNDFAAFDAPTLITDNSATLNSRFTNQSGDTTTAWFEYGSTTAYGSSTAQVAYSVVGLIKTAAPISGLSQRITYHYRLVTQNSAGISYDDDRTFTTLATPEVLASDLDAAVGLPFDGTYVYWFEIYSGKLRRAVVSTGAVSTLATVTTAGNGGVIAIDSNYIYFATYGGMMRANLDGSNLIQNFSTLTDITLIVPHSTGIYVRHSAQILVNGVWTYPSYISRVSLDGSQSTVLYERTPLGSEGFGGDIVIDDTNIYWSDYLKGTIQKMALSGGTPVTMALGLNQPSDLLLDGTTIYVTTNDGIKKLPTTGGTLTDVFSGGFLTTSFGTGVMTKDGNDLYVAGNGMGKIDLLTGVATPLVSSPGIDNKICCSPVVTSDHIYWVTEGNRYSLSGNYGKLERIPKF